MSSIQQFLDPWGFIIFLKYKTTLEKTSDEIAKLDFK